MSDPSPGATRPLDALNLFLADVRDGLGPYLAIYLLTVQHWDEASIGIAMSAAAVAGVVAQTPAGALIDRSRAKRGLIIAAAIAVTLASLALPLAPTFWPVVTLQAVTGVAAAIFPPAVAAVTLGIVGPRALVARIGRNEAFNHAGNAAAATIAGASAYLFGPIAVFWLMAVMAVLSIGATLAIPERAIDHDRARGLEDGETSDGSGPSGLGVLLTCRPLLVFATSFTLFHFGNAAMLPLVGQKLALGIGKELGTTLVAVCVVVAQAVMIPAAIVAGRRADRWGRKPLLLAGFAVLVARGILYTLSDRPAWLVAVQCLDGVGAGLFGALFPVIVADLTRGTGRFNVSQGAVATAQGVGAAISTAVAGALVVAYGYSTAFLALAGAAALGGVVLLAAMPETGPSGAAGAGRSVSGARGQGDVGEAA